MHVELQMLKRLYGLQKGISLFDMEAIYTLATLH